MEILGASQPGWYGEGSKGAGRECPVEQRTSQLLPARPPPGTPGASLKGRDQRRGLGGAGQGLGAAGQWGPHLGPTLLPAEPSGKKWGFCFYKAGQDFLFL